ncbi:Pol polyprotein, partial [Mucuna pruriens]
MGSFPISYGNSYVLLVIDYVSRWVDAKVWGVPRALISDQGSQFCNSPMVTLLEKYGVVHRVSTTYHPQTNNQAEVFNRKIKKLLQKMENPNRNDRSRLLEDTLWVHRTAYRTLLGMSPTGSSSVKLVTCRLKSNIEPTEQSRSAIWPMTKPAKKGNFSCRNWRSYAWKLMKTFGSTSKRDEVNNRIFKVNGHQIKPYHEGPTLRIGEVESISLMDKNGVPDEAILAETEGISTNRRRLGQLKVSQLDEVVSAKRVPLLADSISNSQLCFL